MNEKLGSGALWAIGGIVLIATVYEVNRKVGIGLFIVALMAMIWTYIRNNPIEYQTPV